MTVDREQEARRDLGTTDVSRGVGLLLTAVLLLFAITPAVVQVASGGAATAWRGRAGAGLAARLHDFELKLEDGSPVRSAFLPWAQWFETAALATGNRKVVVGRDGWLYFVPDLEYLTAPGFLEPRPRPIGGQRAEDVARTSGPQALAALQSLADTVAAKGATLVVLVVPGKAAIELGPPAQNPSFGRFAAALEARGATVLDATPVLARARAATARPLYLYTDTHWRPEGLAITAQAVGEALANRLPAAAPLELRQRPASVERAGNLWHALRLPATAALYEPERVTIQQVLGADGASLRPHPDADLLVMGDSFTNIYGEPTMGWGDSAGLAEQIAFALGRPFDRIAVTGGGPAAPLRALAQTPERLDGKRVVVFQLVALELLSGDWGL